MQTIFYWCVALALITGFLYQSNRVTEANDAYWSAKVTACSNRGGFMNQQGVCDYNK